MRFCRMVARSKCAVRSMPSSRLRSRVSAHSPDTTAVAPLEPAAEVYGSEACAHLRHDAPAPVAIALVTPLPCGVEQAPDRALANRLPPGATTSGLSLGRTGNPARAA